MKTTIIKQLAFMAVLALGLSACKKDKKDPEPGPPAVATKISISELKALSTAATVSLPDLKKIKGVVISDLAGKNVDSKTVILQEATVQPGIVVNFDAAQTFAAGDEVEVVVSKQTLAKVNEEVVLQNIPKANATKTGSGVTITARTATTAEIKTNAAASDGTLVKLSAGIFSGGSGKYTGKLSYADNTGSVSSAIVTGASFENSAYPVAVNALTGIVRVSGSEVRVDMRTSIDSVSKEAIFTWRTFRVLT